MKKRTIKITDFNVGEGSDLLFILGPCVIKDYASLFENAKQIKSIAESEQISFIFKASYDKANRTSLDSFRGVGLKEGLSILSEIKKTLGILITSDIHSPYEAEEAASVLDLIQIPALLCRQTDIIVEAAKTGKPVNIKKGQFMAPWDVLKAVDKVYQQGNKNVIVTERGSCFGYNYLINDFKAIPRMQKDDLIVIFDATHSVQLPSKGVRSGGEQEYVSYLSRAAAAVGVDGFFLEVHENPEEALSDASSMIDFKQLQEIIRVVKKIKGAADG
ncbi:MAG: 3-deoxy-8-phosphooctulonate synthase [Candidatus Kaelpia imicola]|nr:3-deoxy-8-phosphooctulonate synthase [Candidatus Kaelpia imicola]